jgi:predicted amidohydrolase YtcJ
VIGKNLTLDPRDLWRRLVRVGLAALVASVALADTPAPADLVLTGARIYTAATPASVEALAITGGKIVYVGSAAGAKAYVGARTRIEDAHGQRVLPGLVDSHIHPIDIVEVDVCDLHLKILSLKEIAGEVHACVKRLHPKPGEWLNVYQWRSSEGNEPDASHPTLRAALDQAAPDNPVHLHGDDGHYSAYNSRALATARNASGQVIGLTAGTLASDFAKMHAYVGLDAAGNPDGRVNEDLRDRIGPPQGEYLYIDQVRKVPERLTRQLNAAGITAVLDAAVYPAGLEIYDRLVAMGRMTVRANLALYFDPLQMRKADGSADFDRLIAAATAIRARYAANPLIHADFFKVFADGSAEGDPYAKPPTLGNAAMLVPYRQPIITIDAAGKAQVQGYVDTDSPVCREVRTNPGAYADPAAVRRFAEAHGFLPEQCRVWSGQLDMPQPVLAELISRVHRAGFHLHVHVIGDRTARIVIDDIEAARAADGVVTTHDSLAHLQFVDPADVARIGRDRLYVAFTYGWAIALPQYDISIVPFVQQVKGTGYAQLHVPGSYYEENSYPCRRVKDAGGIVVAGSDAPVDGRDPKPFFNMAVAVTRSLKGEPPMGPRQALTLREVLDAYTIDGARFLGRGAEIGSLEVGKSADFIVLDRDILALADAGRTGEIYDTRVIETWFRGERVYAEGLDHPQQRP